MTYPIPGVGISTPYGKRGPYWSCNANSSGGVHTGVDFACPQGTDILAPIAGQIRHRSYGSAFGGHQFAISPDDGQPFGEGEVFFAHTTDRLADGVRVEIGDYVASVGAEGNVSGPHLHMEYHPDTKGVWSCSAHANPQPVLDHGEAPDNPGNPNDVDLGDTAIVTASGSLNGRAEPDGGAPVVTTRPYGAEIGVEALENGWALSSDAWFSTDYLYPKVTPAPKNPHGVAVGDDVTVTAEGGLTARVLPGGPPRLEDGEPLVRPHGYTFDVTALEGGWASGGTNWYSTDYLDVVAPPIKPTWSASPTLILDDITPQSDRYVSYMQAVVRVGAVDNENGHWDACYIVGQDYKNAGNLRFGLFKADGVFTEQWMQVNDGGHGQTFHAYRSAAGNLYVWCGENPAYRYRWQNGATVSKSSGDKMDYKGCRPVGSYEPWVGFRDATDTRETFYLFDRSDFTDGTNRTTPAKSVTVDKRTNYTQQSWAVSDKRIYRIMGSTNDDPPHGSKLHILDVFDWSGKLLLDRWDITAMAISTTSDEPEGLTFTGTPGNVLAGKREGSSDPAKRSYPLWTLTGLP